MRSTDDTGSIVLGWLTKLTVSLSLVGLVVFDGISLVSANFTAADRASAAARVASDACQASKGNVQKAYDAAYGVALENGDVVDTEGFSCLADGTVTLSYRREAATLVMEKVGPLRRFTTVTATGTGRPS